MIRVFIAIDLALVGEMVDAATVAKFLRLQRMTPLVIGSVDTKNGHKKTEQLLASRISSPARDCTSSATNSPKKVEVFLSKTMASIESFQVCKL